MGRINYEDSIEPHLEKRDALLPEFIKLALFASKQAFDLAQISPSSLPYPNHRCGVSFGSGIGSLPDVGDAYEKVLSGSSRRISPHFVPRILVNMAAGHIGIK